MRISGIAVVSSIAIPEPVSLSSFQFQVSHNTTADSSSSQPPTYRHCAVRDSAVSTVDHRKRNRRTHFSVRTRKIGLQATLVGIRYHCICIVGYVLVQNILVMYNTVEFCQLSFYDPAHYWKLGLEATRAAKLWSFQKQQVA